MGILNIDISNVNLDNNFDEDDPDTIFHIKLLAWLIKFQKCKAKCFTKRYEQRINACSVASR